MVKNKKIRNIVLVVGLFITPVFLLTLFLLSIYRFTCHVLLKITEPDYRGLLNILELMFASERGPNQAIVNVSAQLKLTKINSGEELRTMIIQLAERTISSDKYEKGTWTMRQRFGVRYWRVIDIDLEKQIRLYDVTNSREAQKYLSRVANEPIHDKMLWEIHVSRNPIDGKYPVIVRIHHSAGDGYAFRQLFLEAQPNYREATERCVSQTGLTKKLIFAANVTLMFVLAPSLCLLQYLEPFDGNSLKTNDLSGKKQLGSKAGEFRKIKRIQKETNSTATEVILTALSKSLEDLFKDRGETVPNLTVSYAMRTSQASTGMENEFLPVALRLPVSTFDDQSRLSRVKKAVKRLQRRPYFMNNYQLPKFVVALLPSFWEWPDWVYESTDMTILLSNLPGPKEKITFDGFEVEDFNFHVMNLQAYNGCGVMISTYMEKCFYSVVLDESLVKSGDDAQRIAEGMFNFIEHAFDTTINRDHKLIPSL